MFGFQSYPLWGENAVSVLVYPTSFSSSQERFCPSSNQDSWGWALGAVNPPTLDHYWRKGPAHHLFENWNWNLTEITFKWWTAGFPDLGDYIIPDYGASSLIQFMIQSSSYTFLGSLNSMVSERNGFQPFQLWLPKMGGSPHAVKHLE